MPFSREQEVRVDLRVAGQRQEADLDPGLERFIGSILSDAFCPAESLSALKALELGM